MNQGYRRQDVPGRYRPMDESGQPTQDDYQGLHSDPHVIGPWPSNRTKQTAQFYLHLSRNGQHFPLKEIEHFLQGVTSRQWPPSAQVGFRRDP